MPDFLHIFLLLHTKLQIHLSHIKITFPCFDSLKFGTRIMLITAYISLTFWGILTKIEGSMYCDIAFFINFHRTYQMHHQCYGSKNFPNTIVLLKADYFKEFSNWNKVDKLVINSMSGCNYKNYKLNNNNYKLKNSLAWKQCFLILRTF